MDLFIALEGDWGGQTYLTVPVVLASGQVTDRTYLDGLLVELDQIAWPCNGGEGSTWDILPYDGESDGGVAGGMGGGMMIPGSVWMHGQFRCHEGLEERVRFLLSLPANVPFIYGTD